VSLAYPQLEAAPEASFASLMDDEDEEASEYDEDQEVIRVDANQEVDESLKVTMLCLFSDLKHLSSSSNFLNHESRDFCCYCRLST
jgi:acyl-CoA thioesterase